MNHLSDVGFEVSSREEFASLIGKLHKSGTETKLEDGTYFLYQDGDLEAWGFNSKYGAGINFYYQNDFKYDLRFSSFVEGKSYFPFEACVYTYFNNETNNNTDQPFIIDIPNYAISRKELVAEKTYSFSLSLFAENLELVENLEEFNKKTAPLGFNGFAGTGTFDKPMRPTAMFGCKVLSKEKIENKLTKLNFYKITVDKMGAKFILLAPVYELTEKLAEGSLLHGTYYFSGKIL